jgi:glycerophosphoryl diester phosphodiesterase
MRTVPAVGLSLLAAVACAPALRTVTPPATHPIRFYGPQPSGHRIAVIAHRGFSGRHPENTLRAFRAGRDAGADGFECDVQLSADGTIVVLHDPDVARTTGGRGEVDHLPLEALRRLDAGDGERIPTLAEALALVDDRYVANLEIKTSAVADAPAQDGIEVRLVHALEAFGLLDGVYVSSFDPRPLARIEALRPRVVTALLYSEGLHGGRPPSEVVREARADAFHVKITRITPEMAEDLHRHHIPLGVYNINERDEFARAIALGATAMITDHPDRVIDWLAGEREGPRPHGER